MTSNIKLLKNAKKIVKQVSREVPSPNLAFSSVIVTKDKQKLDKSLPETNAHLKNFCLQKSIGFIDNKNINESSLGKKELHLSSKGKAFFAKNLMGHRNRVD